MFQRSQSLRVAIELFVAGHAPHVGGDAVFLFQNLLRFQHLEHDGAAAEQLRPQLGVFLFGVLEAVQAFQNAIANVLAVGHLRHGQRLVGDGQVIEDRFLSTYMRLMPS